MKQYVSYKFYTELSTKGTKNMWTKKKMLSPFCLHKTQKCSSDWVSMSSEAAQMISLSLDKYLFQRVSQSTNAFG